MHVTYFPRAPTLEDTSLSTSEYTLLGLLTIWLRVHQPAGHYHARNHHLLRLLSPLCGDSTLPQNEVWLSGYASQISDHLARLTTNRLRISSTSMRTDSEWKMARIAKVQARRTSRGEPACHRLLQSLLAIIAHSFSLLALHCLIFFGKRWGLLIHASYRH